MIRLSRFARPRWGALRQNGRWPAVTSSWYVACCVLGGGCLYTAPVWTEGVNQPPEIIRPRGTDEPHDLVLFSDLPVVVVAADEEDDPLVFFWLTPFGELPSNERQELDLTTSTAVIPYDPELDGEIVEVLVVDQSPAHNDTTVEFLVEIP